MIPPKAAVDSALDYVRTLYEGAARDPLLEELELAQDKKYWLVTIGFNAIETVPASSLEEAIANAKGLDFRDKRKLMRKFRVLKVDADSGQVESLKAKEE